MFRKLCSFASITSETETICYDEQSADDAGGGVVRKPNDLVIESKLESLRDEVETWARRNELWYDCGFFDYIDRVKPNEWDRTGYATVLAADGPIRQIAISRDYMGGEYEERLSEEFDRIMQDNGFWYENYDHAEMWIYATEPGLESRFREYMRWKWICSLIKPEFDLLDHELYTYFGDHPDQLSDLRWRDFEKILAALLGSQGYEVELGPGRNDGGVDIRLLQRDPIGDILTLVQAKRYSPHRKIKLEAVQALYGVSTAEGADRSMFATTSTYSPSARTFAARDNVPMVLHTSSDVQRWCVEASNGIVEDKRKLVSQGHVSRSIERARKDHRQIVVSTGGYDMVTNRFAIVLKETENAALLLDLSTRQTEHDGYGLRGHEVPDLDSVPLLSEIESAEIRRARKIPEEFRKFSDDKGLYSPWDGSPAYFDHYD